MTTNESIDIITNRLKRVQAKDSDIQINYQIAKSVDFLDVTIMNEQGRLKTLVYHKSAAEPYILPFTSNHPRHIHRNIPYAALLRAARLCSDIEDFHAECVRNDVSLLLNDYPSDFISQQRNRFFEVNHAMLVWTESNKQDYDELHHKLLHTLTKREKQLMMMMTEDPIRTPSVLQMKPWDTSVMYVRYLFDSSNAMDFQRRFLAWWKIYYIDSNSPMRDVDLRLIPRTGSTLENFFIRKKPSKNVLKKLEDTFSKV